jgi:hypothetical protein
MNEAPIDSPKALGAYDLVFGSSKEILVNVYPSFADNDILNPLFDIFSRDIEKISHS